MPLALLCRNGGRIRQNRLPRGSTIAELGPTLMVVFFIFSFPLMSLATLGFRYVFLLNAARMAANAGAKCSSWSVDIDPNGSPPNLSAVTAVTDAANLCLSKLGAGITLTQAPQCQIWQCPPNGQGAPSVVPGPTKPKNGYIYNLQVVLKADIAPLVNAASSFVNLPGVTSPIHTQARADVVFENPNAVTNP